MVDPLDPPSQTNPIFSLGDYMSREEIKKMAYGFMKKSALSQIDTNHNQQPNGCYVVESFIARDDEPRVHPGNTG